MAKTAVNIIVGAKDRTRTGLKGVERGLDRLKRKVLSTRNVFAGVLGGALLIRQAGKAVEAIGRQELAVVNLANALALLGPVTQANTEDLEEWAAGIQRVTTMGDEAVLELAALGAGLGKLSGQGLKDATVAAIGLSKRLKIDTVAAMRLVARAAVGDTQMLARYGLKLDATLDAQGKFNELLTIGAASFALARGEIQTTAGRIAQMKNTVGDLQESIGQALLPTFESWVETGRSLAEMLQEDDEALATIVETAKTAGKVLIGIWAAPKIIGGIVLMTKAVGGLTAAMGLNAAASGAAASARLAAVTATTASAAATAGATGATIADVVAMNASTTSVWANVKAKVALRAASLAVGGGLAIVAAGALAVAGALARQRAQMLAAELAMRQFNRTAEAFGAAQKTLRQARGEGDTAAEIGALKEKIRLEQQFIDQAADEAAEDRSLRLVGINLDTDREKRAEKARVATAEAQGRNARKRRQEAIDQLAAVEKRFARERAATKVSAAATEAAGTAAAAATARQAKAADENKRLAELRAQFIADGLQRELELIALRYDREIAEAEKAGREIVRIVQAEHLEIDLVRRKFADRAAKEAAARREKEAATAAAEAQRQTRIRKDAADEQRRVQTDIAARTRNVIIELTKEGLDKELALAAERFRAELAAVAQTGAGAATIAALKRTQDLERQLVVKRFVEGQAGAGAADGDGAPGGPAAREARVQRFGGRFGGGVQSAEQKQADVDREKLATSKKILKTAGQQTQLTEDMLQQIRTLADQARRGDRVTVTF